MDETVLWTNLRPAQIAALLDKKYGIRVSRSVIRKLLKKHNYRRRKAQKKRTRESVPNRNEQFENIARQIAKYQASDCDPILSMDTKKKEYLGNLYRDGHLYTLEELQTLDHDFVSYAEGVIIPHSIYDLKQNLATYHFGA